ncbi:FtsX-like permease family protein [Streptomyces sp. WAC05374]|uniref:ABC transporter permease n=1 Tax=Streptomyces sp. WAC05374 TaxID=2487420 RepID=UPI000F88F48D|nr:ABC transporter permease [Streptomyces sp. WAC05374]RST13197.1 FtsX-like permease family protein [Streptomyces sp. WAC05374]TDF50685.1 FtsX-like permease family protein [Streptomyces sp. WAC05374]TDF56975.1 FtsX-like permease family protein [Streptomyces sp. WAC05374]TDF60938.1 FtsX-like permease family protein [Streptomyces sp. WAC05374]
MRAMLRWAHADLRTHRGEALFLVAATAGIVASLLLATALFGYATNPWQRVFTQSRGAHVWLHTGPAADTGRLAALDGVAAVSGPYRTATTTAASRGARAGVELRATGAGLPATGRPLITAGRWLDPATPDGVVLEAGLARALWAEPGDRVTVTGRTLTVLGVAETAERRYRPGERPGTVWALPRAVPGDRTAGQVVGLRLADPDDTDYTVQRAVTAIGAGAVNDVSTWQQARAEAQGDTKLLGQVLGLFGIGALVAAALAVFGAIATRVRGHLRDISVLKAVGFTPGQVVRIFLVQHLAFAVLGAALAVLLVRTLGGRLPGRLGDAVQVWQGLPGHLPALLLVPAAAVLFIGAATCLAAWRAGRVPPVPVLPPAAAPGGGLSGAARKALGLRVPPALVLGWHRAFGRGRRAPATIVRLALPLLLITVALGAWTTIERFDSRPEQLGLAAALTARPDSTLTDREAAALLAANPGVRAAHPGLEVAALVPGQTGTIALRGLGTRERPYPYSIAEGRAAHGPDEAVAGQGLLDLLGAHVGDWVRLTVGGHPQVLHIVGRSIEPENGGRVVSTSLDTLRENDPALRPSLYQLQLRPGADPRTVGAELADASGGRLDVHEVTSPADRLSALRGVVAGLIGVLALIGLTELSTAIGGTVRDGERDLLALKAIGLSPRQITTVTVTAIGCTALAAALAGTALGVPFAHWLIDHEAHATGIGAGIAQAPPPLHLLALTAAAVTGALALAALPAARATRRRLADTLSAVA